jgi:hypothetical protein
MSKSLCAVVLCCAASAHAGQPFPWEGEQKLEGKTGALVWTVKKSEGETIIAGKHPQWSVTHRCAPDGTPRETVKTIGARTTRLLWTKDGVEYTFDTAAKKPAKKIAEKGLWDGDTLDARLAGIAWNKGKKVEFRIVDTEKDAGDVVPMSAEFDGDATCSAGPCVQVKMKYTGFGAVFVAPWLYRYGKGAGAPYQQYEHEKEKFTAAPAPGR